MGEVTQLIGAARAGDRGAFDRIFELLYPELRQVAHRRLSRGARDGLMETTALVNECYLKFLKRESLTPEGRAHFLAYAATVMRSIIVDAARAAKADRRGGDAEQVTLDSELIGALPAASDEILDVHEALEELSRIDERLAQVVEMRYFGGLEDDEIAEALGLSSRTVRRDWDKARLLLAHALRD
jgi:RNA polymerase sigma factor (TIGR02999 family)